LGEFIRERGFTQAEAVDLVRLPQGVYILYIEENGEDYGVTLSANEFSPFENGSIYRIATIVQVYREIYAQYKPYESLPPEQQPLGGLSLDALRSIAVPVVLAPVETSPEPVNFALLFALVSGAAVASLAGIYALKRSRKA
jgi:hypothetical protein